MASNMMKEFPEALKTVQLLDKALQMLPDAPKWTIEGTSLFYSE
jgi:hypothetical protein